MNRILTALVVLPFLIASILIASLWWVFVLMAAAAMVLGLWEFYLLAKRLKLQPDPAAGYDSLLRPLVACSLPAFALLTIVPSVAGALQALDL